MGNVTIPMPDNCTAETITVVYRVTGEGISTVPEKAPDQGISVRRRVDSEYEMRFCEKNPSREENKDLASACKVKGKKHHRKDDKVACQHCEKLCKPQGLHMHEKSCSKNPDNSSRHGVPDTLNAEKSVRNPMVTNEGKHVDHKLDSAPYLIIEDVPKKNILQAIFGNKKIDLPEDFDPKQELTKGAYVWHKGWKVGKIKSMGNPDDPDPEKRLPLISFGLQDLHFTPEGLHKMFKDIMRMVK